jgi:hypothetical protein
MSPHKLLPWLALVTGLVLPACSPSAGDNAAPPSKENELRKELADAMRGQSAAEAALAAAKADEAQKLAVDAGKIAELQAKVDDFEDKLAADGKTVADTRYVVLKKITTQGTLIQSDPKNHPNEYARTPATFAIVFKGAESGREYPPLEVRESAYDNFREGETCTREDIARAKP